MVSLWISLHSLKNLFFSQHNYLLYLCNGNVKWSLTSRKRVLLETLFRGALRFNEAGNKLQTYIHTYNNTYNHTYIHTYTHTYIDILFKVCKSVHHRTIQINYQPDGTVFQFIILTFVYSSTCFGSFPANHQELNDCSDSLWIYLRIVVTVVLCSWSGRLY
jgi:hypothetical protein